ncbi:MAG: AbrB/MazE/SpoVT family DNA-binding domain-containing protein [Nitrospirae bacterium]|nr:AbrB/MazE/SpoVT family DNA-binding domain-containing protein [Nitrospirota bacterium]
MLVKRTRANQVTIPKSIMKNLGDIEYFNVSERDGLIVLSPVDIKGESSILPEVRAKIKKLGITERDIDKAIKSVRAERAT